MKVKVISLVLSIAMLMSLCGCMCGVADITINKDGSGVVKESMGFTTEGINQLIAMGADLGDLQDFTYKGVSYHGEIEELKFANIEELNNICGSVLNVTAHDNSFAVVIKSTEDALDEQVGEYSQMEGFDLSSMVMDISIDFPYPVTQASGSTKGVTINGNRLTLDIIEMASNPSAVAFHVGEVGRFTDVGSNAWYTEAIDYAYCADIVHGYGNGRFGPNDKLTTAALCQIIYNMADVLPEEDNHGYWAYPAIKFCLQNGYVNGPSDIKPEDYNVSVSREVAVAALNRFLFGAETYYSQATQYIIPDYLEVADEYKNDIRGAYENGIVCGVDAAGTFLPTKTLTRAEFCQIYYNYNNMSKHATEVN